MSDEFHTMSSAFCEAIEGTLYHKSEVSDTRASPLFAGFPMLDPVNLLKEFNEDFWNPLPCAYAENESPSIERGEFLTTRSRGHDQRDVDEDGDKGADSKVDIAEDWIYFGDDPEPKKRKRSGNQKGPIPANQVISIAAQARERLRGRNWEKKEEDILVELRGTEMSWKMISKRLEESGFVRNEKHCADKWYALRKHFLDIQLWISVNPDSDYWTAHDSERIRSVPASFSQKWYEIFDAVEKREGKRRSWQKPGSAGRSVRDRSPDHSLPNGFPSLLKTPTSESAGAGVYAGPRTALPPNCSNSYAGFEDDTHMAQGKGWERHAFQGLQNICGTLQSQAEISRLRLVVAEVRNLTCSLKQKFAAEESRWTEHLAVEQEKLKLKRQSLEYKRQRDEDKRKQLLEALSR